MLLAVGDSGYSLRSQNYNTVLTGAAHFRSKLIPGQLEAGVRTQVGYEPSVRGNRNALYASPGINSDVSGRFSWEVHVRTTAGRASASMEPSGTQQEYGAALQFSHQREDEAQTEVARQIAGQAAGLFDSFLASPLAAPVTDGGPAVRPGLDAPDGGNGGGPELGG